MTLAYVAHADRMMCWCGHRNVFLAKCGLALAGNQLRVFWRGAFLAVTGRDLAHVADSRNVAHGNTYF